MPSIAPIPCTAGSTPFSELARSASNATGDTGATHGPRLTCSLGLMLDIYMNCRRNLDSYALNY